MPERIEIADKVAAFLELLAARNQTLLATFNNLVNAFNNGDFLTVNSMLDDNVTLTTLKPPVTITPKSAVAPYIEYKIADDNPALIPLPPIHVDSTTGEVHGKATWLDNDEGVLTSSIIHYKFTFVLHSDGAWYVLFLTGTPD